MWLISRYAVDSATPYILHFFDLSTGDITNWYWDFGDGNISTEISPTHMYNTDDIYNVCLTVSNDSSSCYDTYCEEILVGCPPCEANFYYVIDSINEKTVHFFDLSTGYLSEWQWDFGDGNSSTGQSVVHTYDEEGIYNVCLTVISACSYCFDTYCEELTIYVPELYNLGGTVFTDSIPIDEGFAYAYQLEDTQIVDVFASFISQYGYYDFYQLEEGDYIIKTELSPNSSLFGQYAPTYYGNVYNWADATILNLDNNIWDADIDLIQVNMSFGGLGSLTGMVTYANGSSPAATNIEVLLLDENDQIIGVNFTDENGEFIFDNLSLGTYKLLVEITGLHATPAIVVLDDANPLMENITFVIYDQMVTLSIPEDLPESVSYISEVFPNPVKNKATVKLILNKPVMTDISIFNITGQELYHTNIATGTGQQYVDIETQNLNEGFYYFQIVIDGSYSITKKIIKTK